MHRDEITSQLQAFKAVAKIVASDTMPDFVPHDSGSIKTAMWCLGHVAVTGTNNWYTYARVLGHPSSELCLKLTTLLGPIRNAYRKQNIERFRSAVHEFIAEGGLQCVHNFIEVVRRTRQIADETSMAYVLFRPSDFALEIGVTPGNLMDFIEELDGRHQVKHGIVGAWLVDDYDQAQVDIASSLSSFQQADGRYLMQVSKAKFIVSHVLNNTQNYFASSRKKAETLDVSRAVPRPIFQLK